MSNEFLDSITKTQQETPENAYQEGMQKWNDLINKASKNPKIQQKFNVVQSLQRPVEQELLSKKVEQMNLVECKQALEYTHGNFYDIIKKWCALGNSTLLELDSPKEIQNFQKQIITKVIASQPKTYVMHKEERSRGFRLEKITSFEQKIQKVVKNNPNNLGAKLLEILDSHALISYFSQFGTDSNHCSNVFSPRGLQELQKTASKYGISIHGDLEDILHQGKQLLEGERFFEEEKAAKKSIDQKLKVLNATPNEAFTNNSKLQEHIVLLTSKKKVKQILDGLTSPIPLGNIPPKFKIHFITHKNTSPSPKDIFNMPETVFEKDISPLLGRLLRLQRRHLIVPFLERIQADRPEQLESSLNFLQSASKKNKEILAKYLLVNPSLSFLVDRETLEISFSNKVKETIVTDKTFEQNILKNTNLHSLSEEEQLKLSNYILSQPEDPSRLQLFAHCIEQRYFGHEGIFRETQGKTLAMSTIMIKKNPNFIVWVPVRFQEHQEILQAFFTTYNTQENKNGLDISLQTIVHNVEDINTLLYINQEIQKNNFPISNQTQYFLINKVLTNSSKSYIAPEFQKTYLFLVDGTQSIIEAENMITKAKQIFDSNIKVESVEEQEVILQQLLQNIESSAIKNKKEFAKLIETLLQKDTDINNILIELYKKYENTEHFKHDIVMTAELLKNYRRKKEKIQAKALQLDANLSSRSAAGGAFATFIAGNKNIQKEDRAEQLAAFAKYKNLNKAQEQFITNILKNNHDLATDLAASSSPEKQQQAYEFLVQQKESPTEVSYDTFVQQVEQGTIQLPKENPFVGIKLKQRATIESQIFAISSIKQIDNKPYIYLETTDEEIPITEDEVADIKKNPDTLKNLVNFYHFFADINLTSVWTYRKKLTTVFDSVHINIEDDSLKTSELLLFVNKLLSLINGLTEEQMVSTEKTNELSTLSHRLRDFSQSHSLLSDKKTFNMLGEDRFASLLRDKGIIGGFQFKTEKLRTLYKLMK